MTNSEKFLKLKGICYHTLELSLQMWITQLPPTSEVSGSNPGQYVGKLV